MAYKEVHRVEISEVIRRWQAGNSQRSKATGTGLSRETVRRYPCGGTPAYAGAGSDGRPGSRGGPGRATATADQRSVLASVSRSGPREPAAPSEEKLAPWSDQIYQWLTQDKLPFTRIQELLAERGCRISYSSRHRWLSRRHWQRRRSASTVRMEQSGPGEVAELDFGRLGYIQDPATDRRGAVWALPVVLVHSRHSFLWPSYSQKLEEVIAGLEAAWEFFGGIPQIPGHRQLPRRGGRGRFPASPPDPWLPGILPAPGLHHRSGPGAPSPGQAPGGAGRPVGQGTLLQGR